MTTHPTPVPDVSDDPHAFLDAVANDAGERFRTPAQKLLDGLVSRLPDGFRSSADYRAKPTPFLFWGTDPDGESPAVPVVPLGRVVLLTGQGGAGKSHLSLTLAVGLASETPVGSFYVRRQDRDRIGSGRSLVVFGEETTDEIEARLDAVCRSVRFKTSSSGDEWRVGLNDDQRALVRDRVDYVAGCGNDLRLTDREGEPTPLVAALVDRIKQAAADGDPYALVVLDPMTRFNGADENDNAAAACMITVLERLTNDTRTTVVAVHHSGKGEGAATNSRGASALVDNARCHLALKRCDGFSELTVEKSNYGPLSTPNGGAPRFWFAFHKAPDAAVYTLQELDKSGREVVRATVTANREKSVVDAAVQKHLDKVAGLRGVDAYVEATPGVPTRDQVRRGTAKTRKGETVQSDDDTATDPDPFDSDDDDDGAVP
jgi:KaiC/GvpD/RAD55 family RecA-like ATPase